MRTTKTMVETTAAAAARRLWGHDRGRRTVNRSHHPASRAYLGLGLAALLVCVALPAARSDSFVNNLLRQKGFSAADLRARDAGEAVVKSLDTPVRRELAHFGIVSVSYTHLRAHETP